MKNVFQNKVAAFEFIHWVRDSKGIIQVSTRVEALKSFHGVTRATYQAFFLMQEHMLETTDFRISLPLYQHPKAFCKLYCCFSAPQYILLGLTQDEAIYHKAFSLVIIHSLAVLQKQ